MHSLEPDKELLNGFWRVLSYRIELPNYFPLIHLSIEES